MTSRNETINWLKLFPIEIGIALTLVGCLTLQGQNPAPAQTEYIDVDYRRFVSGLYINELRNKYVKMDCAFGSMMPGSLPSGYPSNSYMSFFVTGPSCSALKR